jgi:hypothetical protein
MLYFPANLGSEKFSKKGVRNECRRSSQRGAKGGAIAMTLASIPLLEYCDHLTKDEFERRYNAMPMTLKAESIEGKVCNVIPGPLEN